jgi:GTP-binding protein
VVRIAIVGRPNVGKSTLFNRLAGRRLAIVDDRPGVTRDRKFATGRLGDLDLELVDTAGFEDVTDQSLEARMRRQTERAIEEAQVVLFVIDAREGVVPLDKFFADQLRRAGKPVVLVANKAEGRAGTAAALEAYSLGLGDPVAVSAEHGEGLSDLMAEVADRLPEAEEPADADRPLRIAIIGRPNAGKSTLLNRLLGEERMITGPEPGLTRDAIAVRIADEQGLIELVDTAGLRRRARIEAPLERMSASASIEALKMAEVVVLTLDATEGLQEQDLTLARLVEREGRALVLALNKWDAVADRNAARRAIADRIETSLAQIKGIKSVTISALTGAGVEKLLPAVREASRVWNIRLPTAELNRWFESALARHQPPLVDGRRLKLRYITQAKARPPTFVIFGTRAEQLPEDYQRYLVNGLRERFDLPGTPIRLQLRGTKNPYAED